MQIATTGNGLEKRTLLCEEGSRFIKFMNQFIDDTRDVLTILTKKGNTGTDLLTQYTSIYTHIFLFIFIFTYVCTYS